MKEAGLYSEIKKAFESLGAAVSKIPGSTYNQGLPDYICTWRGKPVHCEVKIITKKRIGELSSLQRAHLERHNAAGAICFSLTYDEPMKQWRAEAVGEHHSGLVVSTIRSELRLGLDRIMTAIGGG